MSMKTLFLNPPSFENYDGGASSRWPATREIESYWYPVWLAYPAGMLEGSRLLDAPPHHVSFEQTVELGKREAKFGGGKCVAVNVRDGRTKGDENFSVVRLRATC